MATIDATRTLVGGQDGYAIRVVWTPVTNADSCAPVSLPEYSDKSIQVLGTFNSAAVACHGSNDGGTTYAALADPGGTAIAISAAGIKAVLENTEYVKPVITGGGGSQSLTIAMLFHLGNPKRT